MVAAIVLASATLTLVRTGGITGDGAVRLPLALDADARGTTPRPGSPTSRAQAISRAPAPARTGDACAALRHRRQPLRRRPELPVASARFEPDAGGDRSRHAVDSRLLSRRAPTGPASAGRIATASFTACEIDTDWSKSPPVELWRRKIGPGWSSFAVQRQSSSTRRSSAATTRSSSCYDLTTGAPVWRHRDAARFWESNGGAGPRGTPTLSSGRVYTLGATGIVNALDAGTGAVGVVAQRRDRHRRQESGLGIRQLAARRRRPRRRRRVGPARRLRHRRRQTALVQPARRRATARRTWRRSTASSRSCC